MRAVTKIEFAEHIAYLLFLKLDHERANRQSKFAARPVAPSVDTWPHIVERGGEDLHGYLTRTMRTLGAPSPDNQRRTTASVLFHDAQPWNIDRMSELRQLITEEINPYHWAQVPHTELGQAFAQLLSDCYDDMLKKRETGQFLTPLPLLTVVAKALALTPDDRVIDPAGGIGSTLIAAHRQMASHGTKVDDSAIAGADIDPQMCRLATMNVLLNTRRLFAGIPPMQRSDSLSRKAVAIQRQDRDVAATVALCNPPFKSTDLAVDTTHRSDFWAKKADLPTNFLQHIAVTLPEDARAAVFVPDTVLFGKGAAAEVRLKLLHNCDVHTLLRLPTGIFRGTNSKANILFFTKPAPRPSGEAATRTLWVYDARTGNHRAGTVNPLTEDDLADFLSAYRPDDPDHSHRTPSRSFKPYAVADLLARPDTSLDLWADLGDDLQDLGSPRDIAASIVTELNSASSSFQAVVDALDSSM
ncbi:N-6 DNA methylase [Streptomyces sp. TRM66268-LWL]|uniref:site-specific DNA-methyltransferase (adenine-specific) n=1 Tax=Streptomyces polyasparticus TaxID=2767826 RepID=A0ABR7SXP0_9ACTN|nr:N-6 DNA methylase [Streptomyces polyasparticus]MBC9719397.1 N-6 DNA methylase [Streptomyces polyasparticus]